MLIIWSEKMRLSKMKIIWCFLLNPSGIELKQEWNKTIEKLILLIQIVFSKKSHSCFFLCMILIPLLRAFLICIPIRVSHLKGFLPPIPTILLTCTFWCFYYLILFTYFRVEYKITWSETW